MIPRVDIKSRNIESWRFHCNTGIFYPISNRKTLIVFKFIYFDAEANVLNEYVMQTYETVMSLGAVLKAGVLRDCSLAASFAMMLSWLSCNRCADIIEQR